MQIVNKAGVVSPMDRILEGLTIDVATEMEQLARQWERYDMVSAAIATNYDEFLECDGHRLVAMLHVLLGLWEAPEYKTLLGHDRIHIGFDMFETLHWAVHSNENPATILLVVLGGLAHDLGRYSEERLTERSLGMDFHQGEQIQFHAALSAKIVFDLWELFFPQIELPSTNVMTAGQAFLLRLMNAIMWHGGPNYEKDPVCHHIQSADRLAGVLGSRQFPRSAICDCVARGAAVYPDRRLDYSRKFPFFNNLPIADFSNASKPEDSWTNLLHYLTMPMRNLYALSHPRFTKLANAMRIESGIILRFLCGGPKGPLFKQIFAPELNPKDGTYAFPQTRLPGHIWEMIQQGPEATVLSEMAQRAEWKLEQLVDEMIQQQAFDCGPEEIAAIHRLFAIQVEAEDKPRVAQALRYCNSQRLLNARQERQFLLETETGTDPVLGAIRSRLLESPLFNL